jgi:hypothetical protein
MLATKLTSSSCPFAVLLGAPLSSLEALFCSSLEALCPSF